MTKPITYTNIAPADEADLADAFKTVREAFLPKLNELAQQFQEKGDETKDRAADESSNRQDGETS